MVLLAWHVDYWDRLGWKDPFGSPAYTARQRAYVPVLKMRGLVTPQLLVANKPYGRDWTARLKAEAAKGAAVAIRADLDVSGAKLRATIRLAEPQANLPESAVVRPVLVQRQGRTEVPRGENKGRTLRDFHFVRALGDAVPAAAALGKGARVEFALPEGVEADNLGLVVLVEDPATMTTIEAADFPLASPRPALLVVRETDAKKARGLEEKLADPCRAAGYALRVTAEKLPTASRFDRWLKDVGKKVEFDERRVFVLGFSAAAPEAIRFAAKHGEKLAGLMLVAGLAPPDAKEIGDLPEKLPVYLLYGKADPVAPMAGGEALRDAMKKAGLEVTWRVLKEGGHVDVLEKGATDYLYWMLTAGR